jgi:hypothetical protein
VERASRLFVAVDVLVDRLVTKIMRDRNNQNSLAPVFGVG